LFALHPAVDEGSMGFFPFMVCQDHNERTFATWRLMRHYNEKCLARRNLIAGYSRMKHPASRQRGSKDILIVYFIRNKLRGIYQQ